jgi:hypothetical protein
MSCLSTCDNLVIFEIVNFTISQKFFMYSNTFFHKFTGSGQHSHTTYVRKYIDEHERISTLKLRQKSKQRYSDFIS